jgi:hypothetical protein
MARSAQSRLYRSLLPCWNDDTQPGIGIEGTATREASIIFVGSLAATQDARVSILPWTHLRSAEIHKCGQLLVEVVEWR